ncbi:MAG: FAD-dependent oxidoreductase [Clostridia bacterium]|nr:FAD-dependent oxidoreductase [Clostridia bacterium]
MAGGNLTGWKRKGFSIDNCIHWLTGTNKRSLLYPIWKDSGVLADDVEIVQEEQLFTLEEDGKRVSLFNDIDKTVESMIAVSPEDAPECRRFGRNVKRLMGLDRTGGRHYNRWITPFEFIALIPGLMKYHGMTVDEYGKCYKSPMLRRFFACLTPGNFSAMAFFYVAASFCSGNAALPAGGSLPAAQRMVNKFKELGGRLLTGKKAVKINLKNNTVTGVEMADGSVLGADAVISTIDPASFFGKILDVPMPRGFGKMYSSKEFTRFSALQGAFSSDVSELPFKGTFMVRVPEYARSVFDCETIVFREFSHEKTNYPEGKNIVQFMAYTDEETALSYIKLAENREEYEAREKLLAETARRIIADTYPEAAASLTLLDVWTPATYKRYTGADMGSFMSFSMPKKLAPVSLGCKIPKIKNLFVATQWQTPPGGLPIAAKAGRLAAKALKL